MSNREKKKGGDRAFCESDNTGQPPKTEANWKPGDPIGYIRRAIERETLTMIELVMWMFSKRRE